MVVVAAAAVEDNGGERRDCLPVRGNGAQRGDPTPAPDGGGRLHSAVVVQRPPGLPVPLWRLAAPGVRPADLRCVCGRLVSACPERRPPSAPRRRGQDFSLLSGPGAELRRKRRPGVRQNGGKRRIPLWDRDPPGHPSGAVPLLRSADEPPWHPALLDDALEVLRDLQSAYDGGAAAKVFLAGFSGSTTLLSLLLAHVSERRPELLLRRDAGVQIVGALCCCFCCDYARAKQLLETSVLGRLYSWLLAGAYQATLCANASTAAQSSSDAWEAARRARFLSDYDRAVYRLCGFASVEAMHAAFAITDSVLARIRVPTLFLQPADDPLHLLSFGSVRAGVPVERLVANPRLLYVEPSHGAHFGFVGSGGVGGDDSYTHAPKVAMVFFETVLADARC